MRSNRELTTVTAQIAGRNGEYDASLEKKTNDVSDMAAQIKLSKRNRAMDFSILNGGK